MRPDNSEVERLNCDNTNLIKNTNWSPKYTLKNGLIEVIKWMQNPDNLNFYKSDNYNV